MKNLLKSLFKPRRFIEGFELKRYKEEKNMFASWCPWVTLLGDGIVLLKSGAILQSFAFSGPDLESASAAEIAGVSALFNDAVKQLGGRWAVQLEAQRYKTTVYPQAKFDNPASYIIDKIREGIYSGKENAHFTSSYYLSFTYELPSDLKQRTTRFFFSGGNHDTEGHTLNIDSIMGEIKSFQSITSKITDTLKRALVIEPLTNDEMLTYLHTSVSLKWHPLKAPEYLLFLDKIITDSNIENTIPLKLGDYYVPVITIKDFPQETYPAIFDRLNRTGIEYRWSTRFICLDKKDGLKEIDKWQGRFHGGRKGGAKKIMTEYVEKHESTRENKGSAALEDDASAAQVEAMTDLYRFGYYTSTLMVWDRDLEKAEEKARMLEGEIAACMFNSIQETANAFEAFLSMQPGNVYANIRRPLISSGNLAHIIPLSAVWMGIIHNDFTESISGCEAPLLTCSSNYATPFFFNLNVGNVGHTFFFGPTGSGKSTILALLAIQFLKYPDSNVIIFDKGRSARSVTMAAGGVYAEPGIGDIGFQPLAELSTASDILWCADFIEVLLTEQAVPVDASMRNAITEALKLMKDIPLQDRTLTTLSTYVSYTNPTTGINDIKAGLSPYLKGGQFGNIFDESETSLPYSKWTMIEMGSLMDLSEKAVRPALVFLFKYIERIWKGTNAKPKRKKELTLLILDEAWLYLDNPVFASRIKEWLLTCRKDNVFVVFATQQVEAARRSSIAPEIVQSCLTKVYLADRSAQDAIQKEAYRYFGLTDAEIYAISKAQPMRDYFYKSALGTRMFNLNLERKQLAILSSDHEYLDLLEKKYGRNSKRYLVFDILQHRGIPFAHFFDEQTLAILLQGRSLL